MLNGFTSVAITKDLTQDLMKSLKELGNKVVCVGIPEEENIHRKDGITNAQLMYIHNHGVRDFEMRKAMQHDLDNGMKYSKAHELYVHENGSPLWQVPPRPILEPALDDGKELLSEQLKEAALAILDGGNVAVELQEVGLLGQNIVRDWFTNPSNKWAPNSSNTVKRKGSDNPLIDSGELRKSITFVIKEGDFND